MIELLNVTKVYEGRKRSGCVAVDRLSFTLPDRGLVFILGKSGSGKSTLLNLMGGLDEPSHGDIVVDGNSFSSLSTAEQDHYRNLYVGFIFQDFCLLEGLTVEENVRLSHDLMGEEDSAAVARSLVAVGLSGYEKRYPRELSGGQSQRVAIARALVKSPRLILADEPTGNLDSRTAVQILELLKELSRDRLVVVVSHNTADAVHYGDRIIELSDGSIVRDVERSEAKEAPLIEGKLITLPRGTPLTEAQLDAINGKIGEAGVRITQAAEAFTPSPLRAYPVTKRPLGKPKRMRPSSFFRLSAMLGKGGYLGTAITALVLTVLILLFTFAEAFTFFESAPLLREAMMNTDKKSFLLHKGYYGDNPLDPSLKLDLAVEVTEEDVAAFYEAGYEGKAYLLYTTPVLYKYNGGPEHLGRGELTSSVVEHHSPYAQAGNGVLATDVEFLKKLYGKEGELSLLVGSMDSDSVERGIYISDYAADCLLYYNRELIRPGENPYHALLSTGAPRATIVGVIDTGYRERYADILAAYESLVGLSGESARGEALAAILSDPAFSEFVNEVDKYLSVGYFLGEDYLSAVTGPMRIADWYPRFHNTDVWVSGTPVLEDVGWMYGADSSLKPGEAVLGADPFNRIFGTAFSYEDQAGFSPVTIELVGYANAAGEGAEPLYRREVTIVGLHKGDGNGFSFSAEDHALFFPHSLHPYAIYFDDVERAAEIYEIGEERGFYSGNLHFKSVYTVKEIVEIFRGMFTYIGAGVAFVAFLLMVSFSLRGLKRRKRDIGILRALGGGTPIIAQCFVLQVLLLGVVVALFAFGLLPLLAESVNSVLVSNMVRYLSAPTLTGLEVIVLSPVSLLAVLAIFLPVLLLSVLVPLLVIRRVKPIRIIRSAE